VTPTFIVETQGRRPHHEGTTTDAALETRRNFAMTAKKAARFRRTARLLRHADFERVYKQGRRHFSGSMTVFYWPRAEASAEMPRKTRAGVPSTAAQGGSAPQGLRVGFTVGRALGGAVQRNRMKRRLREAVRLSGPPKGVAADVVINPKKSLLVTDFSVVLNEVTRAFAVIEQKLSEKPLERAPAETAISGRAGGRKPETGSRS
jgi:ribonuclease P protein component